MKKKFTCSVVVMLLVGILFCGCEKKEKIEVEITSNECNFVQRA